MIAAHSPASESVPFRPGPSQTPSASFRGPAVVGRYVGRFAPSPTGPLHAGSLVAALASWLDARAQRGRWLVRIEDVDSQRCARGADGEILRQLTALGLHADGPALWQSTRSAVYERSLENLCVRAMAYPCRCTRRQIALAWAERKIAPGAHHTLIYPGTCRPEPSAVASPGAGAWRFRVADGVVTWRDRALGPQSQDVARDVGDFTLRRADGLWAYQLAVVVDDAHQGVTCVVRGEDLLDNTARQIRLQGALGVPTPSYLHVPLVMDDDGRKLSKQHGAPPIDTDRPLLALQQAARHLGLPAESTTRDISNYLDGLTAAWALRWLERSGAV